MTQDNAPPSIDDWKLVAPAGFSFRRATVDALGSMYDWGNRVAWVAAALSVPFFLYVAVYMAPAEQRVAQKQEGDAIERENIAFCEKHGMPVGTREYGLCAEDGDQGEAKPADDRGHGENSLKSERRIAPHPETII